MTKSALRADPIFYPALDQSDMTFRGDPGQHSVFVYNQIVKNYVCLPLSPELRAHLRRKIKQAGPEV